MTMFWVYAALLTTLALAILVTPLMRNRGRDAVALSREASNLSVFRDQLDELDADLAAGTIDKEQWGAARADLQRGFLEDTGAAEAGSAAPFARSGVAAAVVALAVPIFSVAIYLVLGSPQGLNPNRASAAQTPESPHELSQGQIESMVVSLAQRLEANPDDLEGWIMLARTYAALGRFNEAAGAYAKAEAKFPTNAQLLADYADSLGMAQGQTLKGRPEELIQRALKADANNFKALALAGSVEFEKQEFAKAAEYWKRILPLLPPDSEMGDSVRASIKDAEDRQGGVQGSPAPMAKAAQGDKAKSAGAAAAPAVKKAVAGTIKLAPALAARAAPEDSVFVLARPAQGSRMPLAAVRVKVKDLPLSFSFDDSMAMSAAAKLSDFAEVVVAARISKSGSVVPQAGDLEGVSNPVRPGTTGMSVEIAKEVK